MTHHEEKTMRREASRFANQASGAVHSAGKVTKSGISLAFEKVKDFGYDIYVKIKGWLGSAWGFVSRHVQSIYYWIKSKLYGFYSWIRSFF